MNGRWMNGWWFRSLNERATINWPQKITFTTTSCLIGLHTHVKEEHTLPLRDVIRRCIWDHSPNPKEDPMSVCVEPHEVKPRKGRRECVCVRKNTAEPWGGLHMCYRSWRNLSAPLIVLTDASGRLTGGIQRWRERSRLITASFVFWMWRKEISLLSVSQASMEAFNLERVTSKDRLLQLAIFWSQSLSVVQNIGNLCTLNVMYIWTF